MSPDKLFIVPQTMESSRGAFGPYLAGRIIPLGSTIRSCGSHLAGFFNFRGKGLSKSSEVFSTLASLELFGLQEFLQGIDDSREKSYAHDGDLGYARVIERDCS